MTWRENFARWICPELGRNADRYWHLSDNVANAYRWLGEFNTVCHVLRWLQASDRDHFRALDEKPTNPYPHRIDDFREWLRRHPHKESDT